ncbi:hypothetical protein F2Q68_00010779 [Brassica cretica]|uniref:Uncharacterized protein n=3 Tax=Brassica TaxID=3705 RepID=A0A8S9KZM3_BRACR|nr:hypothetical protein F2Q68_00010779 [Brassica cretica]
MWIYLELVGCWVDLPELRSPDRFLLSMTRTLATRSATYDWISSHRSEGAPQERNHHQEKNAGKIVMGQFRIVEGSVRKKETTRKTQRKNLINSLK